MTLIYKILGSYAKNFNSHAHVERDSVNLFLVRLDFYFNSHAHVERDYMTMPKFTIIRHFNSHAHVERDSSETCQGS